MIEVRVLDIRPHPDQATNNPGTWAVRFQVSRDGVNRTFWRWHSVRECDQFGRYIVPTSDAPKIEDVVIGFWNRTFDDLHGFNFDKEDP